MNRIVIDRARLIWAGFSPRCRVGASSRSNRASIWANVVDRLTAQANRHRLSSRRDATAAASQVVVKPRVRKTTPTMSTSPASSRARRATGVRVAQAAATARPKTASWTPRCVTA